MDAIDKKAFLDGYMNKQAAQPTSPAKKLPPDLGEQVVHGGLSAFSPAYKAISTLAMLPTRLKNAQPPTEAVEVTKKPTPPKMAKEGATGNMISGSNDPGTATPFTWRPGDEKLGPKPEGPVQMPASPSPDPTAPTPAIEPSQAAKKVGQPAYRKPSLIEGTKIGIGLGNNNGWMDKLKNLKPTGTAGKTPWPTLGTGPTTQHRGKKSPTGTPSWAKHVVGGGLGAAGQSLQDGSAFKKK